jgi:prophage endopeptidase
MLLAFCAYYYHGEYKAAAKDLQLASDTIKDMQTRQRDVAILDAKYTKELSDAKQTIDQLQSDVASGAKRLSVRARCVPKAAATSSVDDGGYARLDDSAQRDYFTLIKRIAESKAMIDGYKEYIRTQCLR